MDSSARFAVPFFFLLSGFYSYQIPCSKIKKRIRNIGTLLIFSVVSYTAFRTLSLLLTGSIDDIVSYLSNYLDFSALVELFLFNVSISSEHLWYLYAILYVYIIFYFVTSLRVNEKVIFIISFLLLLINILLGEGFSILGIVVPIPLVRNFALTGIPFFVLGLFAKNTNTYSTAFPIV